MSKLRDYNALRKQKVNELFRGTCITCATAQIPDNEMCLFCKNTEAYPNLGGRWQKGEPSDYQILGIGENLVEQLTPTNICSVFDISST